MRWCHSIGRCQTKRGRIVALVGLVFMKKSVGIYHLRSTNEIIEIMRLYAGIKGVLTVDDFVIAALLNSRRIQIEQYKNEIFLYLLLLDSTQLNLIKLIR